MAKVSNLKYEVGNFSLDIPNWEFSDHGITAIWGPSGSGKSTLLNILAGLIPYPNLYFLLNGKQLSNQSAAERNFGYVFQDYGLFPHLSVWENIEIACKARKLSQWEGFAQNLLSQLGILKIKDRSTSVLSGGEKQRVSLARALAVKPSMVLLDEPLSALDQSVKDDSRELIRNLAKAFAIPFLMITHDFNDLMAMASEIIVIKDGRCLGYGSTQALINDPPSVEFALSFPIFQILNPTKTGAEPMLGSYRLNPHKVLGKSRLLAKNWSFEIKTGQGGNIESVSVISTFGPLQLLRAQIKSGPAVKCISYMDPGLLAQTPPDKLDLVVNNNSIIYID